MPNDDAEHKLERVKKVLSHWKEWQEQSRESMRTIPIEHMHSYISVGQTEFILGVLSRELEGAIK